jgi:hypothetical protein
MAADLAATVKTVSAGIDTLKKLADLALKTQNLELQEGIIELRIQLLDLKEALLGVKEESLTVREENESLRKRIANLEQASKPVLIGREGLYYKESGEGPFCPSCYQGSGQISLLGGTQVGNIGVCQCPSCTWKLTKA